MAVVAGQQDLKLTKWAWPAVHQVWFDLFTLWLSQQLNLVDPVAKAP